MRRIASLFIAVTLCVCAAGASALTAAPWASAAALTPGDVVVYRVGAGTGALSSAAAPVFFDEYEPSGKLVESLALPTAVSGSNKPLLASGSGGSEGLLTLSGNDEYLLATGYDTSVGKENVSETESTAVPRTIARVSAGGEINTTTALTDFANKNNPRGATSSDGTHIWVGGAGKSTTGGVHYTTLGSSTSTLMSSNDTNARAVAIYDGQLYTSADPTKESVNIATVGSGLPTSSGQSTTDLPFATAPSEPYAFSFVTLGMGSAPDTLYVADNGAGAVVKYGLSGGGQWVKEGSVAVSGVTGVTADDSDGVVSIYATNETRLYKITDTSGVGGELKGSAEAIASAPANELFRGVAFAPGTTFGSGGAPPPPPSPTISTEQSSLAAALQDPTNPGLGLTVADSPEYAPGELTVTAQSSNTTVAPQSEISITGAGASRALVVTPGAVGVSTITLTVTAPNGAKATTSIEYGVSAYQGDPSDRYYAGAGNGSTAIDVGGGYMIVGDDENNVLRLYHERFSGPPVKTFDFTSKLPFGATEMDIESSARAGDTLYWMGSLSNSKKGKLEPGRDVLFAARITGSGASTELEYLGSYTHLREDLVAWDEANGDPLGFRESTESGVPSNEARGFNVEGLEFAAGSTSTAYIAFRAPLEPPSDRADALLVPVTDFSSLVTGEGAKATFGAPIEWNLGGLGIREIRRNAAGEFLFIAGTPDDSNSQFGLYTWDGDPAHPPVLTNTPIAGVAEGAWESIVSVPEPIASGDQVELLEDNGDTVWYENGQDSKDGLPSDLQKDLGRVFTIELATTTTTVSSSDGGAGAVGAPVTYTATVAPSLSGNGVPTGVVSFSDSHGPISGCSNLPLSEATPDTATCETQHEPPSGTYEITASYSGDSNYTGSSGSAIENVGEAPQITSAGGTTFTEGAAGSLQVTATGAPAPTISESGALPAGVEFNSGTGMLAGTPTQEGVFHIEFTASNGVSPNAVQSFTLTVAAPPVITSPAAATFNDHESSMFALTATGTPAPTISEWGNLPAGVTFENGVLSGTPTQSGTFAITFTASNGVGADSVQRFTLTVAGLHVTTTSLPAVTPGVPYSQQLQASGGVEPYKWSKVSSKLPAGLRLSKSGLLSGTVRAKKYPHGGSFTITVKVTDSTKRTHQTATATLTVAVRSAT